MGHIVLTGTESTFKSTLAQALSAHFGFPWVEEYARQYIQDLNPAPNMHDFPKAHFDAICQGQLRAQQAAGYSNNASDSVLFDTDGITLYLWGKDKFGEDERELLDTPSHIHYLLCAPTNKAADDVQRIDRERREELHERYTEVLRGKTVEVLSAVSFEDRLAEAIAKVEQWGFKPRG